VTDPIEPGHEPDGKGPTGSPDPSEPKGDGKGPTAR
jgi:hypothetical protein